MAVPIATTYLSLPELDDNSGENLVISVICETRRYLLSPFLSISYGRVVSNIMSEDHL